MTTTDTQNTQDDQERLETSLADASDTQQPQTESTSPGPVSEGVSSRSLTPDIRKELSKLVELATRYPEIGVPVAEIALKTGYPELSGQLLEMGLQSGQHGLEYFVVAARLARREANHTKAISLVIDALKQTTSDLEAVTDSELEKLPPLVRLGFSVMLFELGGADTSPELVTALTEHMPEIALRLPEDALFQSLLAQTLWFNDRAQSEAIWTSATQLENSASVWNSRGTWYKEVEHDLEKAEATYREGLTQNPKSGLLLHNIAQLLLDKAEDESRSPKARWTCLNEAEGLLRRALRATSRPWLRRHTHETFDRLQALQTSTPRPQRPTQPPPKVGDVVEGRVKTLTTYGAFVELESRRQGLLHKTEMAHEHVFDPAELLSVGDRVKVKVIEVTKRDDGRGGLRIGLSRKALLPAPAHQTQQHNPRPRDRNQRPGARNNARGERRRETRGGGRGRGGERRSERQSNNSLGTLGDLMKAKLQQSSDNDAQE